MLLLPALIELGAGEALIAVTLLAVPLAALAFARSGPLWREIGKGPLAMESEPPPRRGAGAGPEPPVDPGEQAAEARQMLEAKAFRARRRGEAGIDVEAEVARLLDGGTEPAPAPGPAESPERAALRAEVRQLVLARNERRARRGEAPLDVEAETERQLADL